MNGLQPVSIRVCRGIPTCPLGTRGTILSRRLAQERVRWYHVPGAADTTTTAAASSSAGLKSTIPISRYTIRRPAGDDEIVQPNPGAAVPLSSKTTKLTPLSIELREAPIRRLLHAIENRRDVAIWRYFSFVSVMNMTGRLSAADFSSVLLSLRPRRYVSLSARHHLNDYGEARLTPGNYSYEEFRRRLQTVTMGMQANGYSLNVLEYAHLLDCARAGRDTQMAEQLWNQMAAQEGITPDVWAYNSYLAAICGTASTDREVRVTDRTISQRTGTGDNVRDIALSIYKRMIERGVTPNAMTFDLLILAVARIGDLASVYRTLKEVWGVDFTVTETPESMRPLMSHDSPLYPSPHTLVAVAAAFGSNNDVESAIRIVDHLSRRYKIPITIPTWITLLNWTFVYSRPPAFLPKYSVLNLWRIMTAPPYHVKPTLEMYDYLVRSLIARKMMPDAEKMINRGLKVFSRVIVRAKSAASELEAALGSHRKNSAYDKLFDLRHKVALARREEYRGRSTIKRWAELLCLGKGMRAYHARVRVPNVVRKMRFFLGGLLHYCTPSGYVQMRLGRKSEWKAISVRRRKRPWMPLGTGAKEMDYFD